MPKAERIVAPSVTLRCDVTAVTATTLKAVLNRRGRGVEYDARKEREMSNASLLLHGVTEARGSYNNNAASQAAGGASALPMVEKAARELALDPGEAPIVIADYGSSQGKNSLAPMRAAIAALRGRLLPRRPICVVHVDVAENDFSTLFDVLDAPPDGYVFDDPDVFPSAVGRSFYRPVLPPGHVHLGWSSYAAVWLSRAPTMIPNHFWIPCSTGTIRAAFERQAAQDWEAFLELRARELRAGGRLVVALPAARDDGTAPINDRMNHLNAVLAEMVADHAIIADERARMILLSYPRRKSELLAPFAQRGRFENLVVEQCEVFPVPDPAWVDYQRDLDKEKLAARHAGFFRATFMPSLASALAPERGADGRQLFIDRLADRLKRRLALEPMPQHLLVQVIVLAKEAEG
jgi:S-adenosylmethionine-dependent carboxyl methyltransferase